MWAQGNNIELTDYYFFKQILKTRCEQFLFGPIPTLVTGLATPLGVLIPSWDFLAGLDKTGWTTAVGVGEADNPELTDVMDESEDNFFGTLGGTVTPDTAEETDAPFVNDPDLEAEDSPRLNVPNSPSRSGCKAAFLASLALTSAS